MLTVNTTEQGLGNHDGHVLAATMDNDTWS